MRRNVGVCPLVSLCGNKLTYKIIAKSLRAHPSGALPMREARGVSVSTAVSTGSYG